MKKRNAQGGGNIRKRNDGRWECRFSFQDEFGQTKRTSIYGATQAEVQKKLTAALAERDKGTFKKPERMTVEQWLTTWTKDYCRNLKPNTITTYESRIEKDILPYIGKVQLRQLKNRQIQRLVNRLSDGDKATGKKPLAPKTVVCTYGVLHKAMEQAKAVGLIAENPANNVDLPKIIKPELKPLVDDSLVAFMKAIQGHQYELLYFVTLFTGLRQSEILGLRWGDIDWEKSVIHVRRQWQRNLRGGGFRVVETPKNSKRRIVTAAPAVLKALQHQKKKQAEWQLVAGEAWSNDDSYIFTDPLGHPLKHGDVYKAYKKIVKSIGIPESRFHDMRHSYSINALAAGDNIKSVSDNLGHYSSAFTMDVYGDTSEAMRERSRNVIEGVIKQASDL